MTFGLGIRVREGLLAIADTRITSGTEVTTARKIQVFDHHARSFFLLTSGLRSVRDKTLTYFDQELENGGGAAFAHLFEAVNSLATHLRRTAQEDRLALEAAGLPFDLHALIGGQLEADGVPRLYLLYPQGNWVEITPGTPYQIIGTGGYGKPVLDRALTYDDSLRHALKVGLLAFDATHISASNVDFPIDVVLLRADPYAIVSHRFEQPDLASLTSWWQNWVRRGVEEIAADWEQPLFAKLSGAVPRP